MTDEEDTRPNALAGRYELGPDLGHGGMGTVRDATDLRLGRSVAVKILRPDLADQPRARRRFETEARAAARLAHPNVVTVFDSGEDAGVPFLVMERLPGRTLADEIASGPLALERARDVVCEILSALDAAHEAGIVHRDVKPGNVLLAGDGHVKVSDFGIAKAIDDVDQTQTVDLVATLAYLAPERLAGEPASVRSDVYSVGVLLYEVIAGRRPFSESTPLAEMRAIERGEAPALDSLRPEVPENLAAVVTRSMARDPARRFDTAAQMRDAMDRTAALAPTAPVDARLLADTERIEAPAGTATVPVHVDDEPGAATATLASRPADIGESRIAARRGFGLIAAVIVAVFIAGVFLVNHDNGKPAPSTPTSVPATTATLPVPLKNAIEHLDQDVAK